MKHLFSDQQIAIIRYCAEEVRRQGDGPLHVAHMLAAWEHAWTQHVVRNRPLSPELIQEIGALVAPEKNLGGFRRYGVRVGLDVKPDWESVPRQVAMLCEAWNEGRFDGFTHPFAGEVGPAERWYFEMESCHPFGDGNGRVGKISYNMLRGTLDDPIWPPSFWPISNP